MIELPSPKIERTDMKELNDFELMENVKKGHGEAFVALVERYQQPLFRFFCRLGASPEEREDLVQEVFLRLFSYRQAYQPSALFTTFLYTLARHVWTDAWRKHNKRPEARWQTVGDSWSALEPQSEQSLPMEEYVHLQMALALLPEKLRLVLVMNIYQGLKYQEIADILQIPLGTVKSRMHLALKQLKAAFLESPKKNG